MAALSVADWCHLSFYSSRLLECSLKKSAMTSRGKNLPVLTKLKNTLSTNLSQFNTLSFEQTTDALHKNDFSSHRQILQDSQDTE